MKFSSIFSLISNKLRTPRLSGLDTKQAALTKAGREQFKKLLDKGLGVPVVFL